MWLSSMFRLSARKRATHICSFRYASTTDHSFYNFENIDGQVYERFTLSSLNDIVTRKGPFAAQKLVYENSAQMMHMCYINTM